MQVKLVITTIAFMLTMIVFGFAALSEPARMELFEGAYESRQVEFGASIYYSNCATCHGQEGKAELCYDAEGEQIGCAGRSLHNAELLCGEPSPRLVAMGWENGTKAGFINATVNAGRAQNGMPLWGADYGGPLEDYEVENVTNFVLNWQTEDLCSEPPPEPPSWPEDVAELPAGDAANGEQLYQVTYGCAACHGQIDQEGTNAVGPWAGAFKNREDTQPGYTAAEYLYESILLPSAYISPECPTGPCAGPPSAMPNNFPLRMTIQEMSDMMAYLLETSEFESNGNAIVYP